MRKQQTGLRKKIDALRERLRKEGVDPDAPAVDLTERNNAIYSRYLDGLTYTAIAEEFKLSTTRISSICRRVEWTAEKAAKRGGQ